MVSDDLIEAFKQNVLSLSYADKLACYKRLKEMAIEKARVDPAAFVEYAIPHEKTKKPIRNEEFHKAWHRFLSSHRYCIVEASVEHGKTFQTAGRAIWEIGKDPTIRMALISAVDRATIKIGRAIRRNIDHNPLVHEVFPDLRRSQVKGDPWTISDMVVDGSGGSAKDPSIQCRSVGSQDVLGSRLDLVMIDDILNVTNTRTKIGRDNLEEWMEDVVITRVFDDVESGVYGRIWFIGNPWHVDDQIARLSGLPGWKKMTTSAVKNPEDPPHKWIPTWPKVWPLERLLDRRSIMHPHTFARKYLCEVLDQTNRRFLKAWLDHTKYLGKGRTLLRWRPTERGRYLPCFTGIDIGVGKKRTDALTVVITLAVDSKGRRILVDIRAGHWTGPEILDQMSVVYERFDSEVYVEGNAAQRFFEDFGTEFADVPTTAVNTGSEKWDEEFGVEALAVLMKRGLMVFPSGPTGHEVSPEVAELVRECYDFDPSSHTGDRLMALWIADKAVRDYLQPRHGSDSDHMDR